MAKGSMISFFATDIENECLRERVRTADSIVAMAGTFLGNIVRGVEVSSDAAAVLLEMIGEYNKTYHHAGH